MFKSCSADRQPDGPAVLRVAAQRGQRGLGAAAKESPRLNTPPAPPFRAQFGYSPFHVSDRVPDGNGVARAPFARRR